MEYTEFSVESSLAEPLMELLDAPEAEVNPDSMETPPTIPIAAKTPEPEIKKDSLEQQNSAWLKAIIRNPAFIVQNLCHHCNPMAWDFEAHGFQNRENSEHPLIVQRLKCNYDIQSPLQPLSTTEQYVNAAEKFEVIPLTMMSNKLTSTVELEFDATCCTKASHFDEKGSHKNEHGDAKVDFANGCEKGWGLGKSSGILVATNPYFVVLTVAHDFDDSLAHSYRMKWFPLGGIGYSIPLQWVHCHPDYKEKIADNDIAVMVGTRSNLPDDILDELDEHKIYPFDLNLGLFDSPKGYELKGFTDLLMDEPLFYKSIVYVWDQENTDHIAYEGAVIPGLSGGGLHCNMHPSVIIGVQSVGVENQDGFSKDMKYGQACALNRAKIEWICEHLPCVFDTYEVDDNSFVTIYDIDNE